MDNGECREAGFCCSKCGQTGDISRDYTTTNTTTTLVSNLICFHCNHRAHKKASFPSLAAAGQVVAPAPINSRITNGRQGKADAPVVRSRVFQLTAKEACETPDVVKGIYLLLISIFILICLLIFVCFLLGSFHINDIYALILFDSGATRSFVLLTLTKRFTRAPGEMDYPL